MWVLGCVLVLVSIRPTRSYARQSVVFQSNHPRSGDRSYRVHVFGEYLLVLLRAFLHDTRYDIRWAILRLGARGKEKRWQNDLLTSARGMPRNEPKTGIRRTSATPNHRVYQPRKDVTSRPSPTRITRRSLRIDRRRSRSRTALNGRLDTQLVSDLLIFSAIFFDRKKLFINRNPCCIDYTGWYNKVYRWGSEISS